MMTREPDILCRSLARTWCLFQPRSSFIRSIPSPLAALAPSKFIHAIHRFAIGFCPIATRVIFRPVFMSSGGSIAVQGDCAGVNFRCFSLVVLSIFFEGSLLSGDER